MTKVDRNKQTAQQFFDRVFNQGDMSAVSSLAPSYTYNGQAMTPQSLIGWVNGMRAEIPDLHFTRSLLTLVNRLCLVLDLIIVRLVQLGLTLLGAYAILRQFNGH